MSINPYWQFVEYRLVSNAHALMSAKNIKSLAVYPSPWNGLLCSLIGEDTSNKFQIEYPLFGQTVLGTKYVPKEEDIVRIWAIDRLSSPLRGLVGSKMSDNPPPGNRKLDDSEEWLVGENLYDLRLGAVK